MFVLTGDIRLITGNRVVVPDDGFPTQVTQLNVQLKDETFIPADLVIPATGQIPNTQFLSGLGEIKSFTNPNNGFIRVKPTLQLQDQRYPYIFAVGDVADTGAHKAAKPGGGQAGVVARNIAQMITGVEPEEHIQIGPPAIHLTLGLVRISQSI
jgi:NADH dehydrogenase FAD-containing subunit